MVKKIIKSGNPILRKVSKPVLKIDKKIKNLIQDLKDTLAVQKDPEGVGLAAPQIGVNLQIFIVDYKNFKRVVINPTILSKKKNDKKKTKKKEILEGCLSLPHYYSPLKRADTVKIKYQTPANENQLTTVTETISGFNAQIILHEIDHLNGILFIDRLLEQKKKLYKLDKKNEWEEVEL